MKTNFERAIELATEIALLKKQISKLEDDYSYVRSVMNTEVEDPVTPDVVTTQPTLRKMILTILRINYPASLAMVDLYDRFNTSPKHSVRSAVYKLVKQGEVDKLDRNKYCARGRNKEES